MPPFRKGKGGAGEGSVKKTAGNSQPYSAYGYGVLHCVLSDVLYYAAKLGTALPALCPQAVFFLHFFGAHRIRAPSPSV